MVLGRTGKRLLTIVLNAQEINGIYYVITCLLYTSDAADERSSVDLGGRRIIKTKTKKQKRNRRHVTILLDTDSLSHQHRSTIT